MNKAQLLPGFENLPVSQPKVAIWRPIHYLGSKLRLLDALCVAVDRLDPGRGPVCDLFAGSGTTSAAFAATRSVVAVDIQEYSRVLCSAVLQPPSITSEQIQSFVRRALGQNHQRRLDAAAPLIEHEQASLASARTGTPNSICDLIQYASIASFATSGAPSLLQDLVQAHQRTRELLAQCSNERMHEMLILQYFGGLYFSYRQAVELDSLLIAAREAAPEFRDCYLAAVISTASDIVNTVGKHFAQPIQPRGKDGTPKRHLIGKILRDRSLDTISIFLEWIERYQALPRTTRPHRVVRSDYLDALSNLSGSIGVIYADPPYTRDHYSRFYHVLETMCLGDVPNVSTTRIRSDSEILSRGMYRKDRHQSPFCIKSQAPKAFEQLFASVKDIGVPLALSYSPYAMDSKARPRVMTVDEIGTLARRFFDRVDLTSAGRVSHMKLNTVRLNTESTFDAEQIFLCS